MTPLTLKPQEIPGVLSGRVTRIFRVLKPQPEGHLLGRFGITRFVSFREESGESRLHPLSLSPGEYWVRETFHATWGKTGDGFGKVVTDAEVTQENGGVAYATNDDPLFVYFQADNITQKRFWRSPVTMPRWASRASIRVTGVRVHRVQDVTEAEIGFSGVYARSAIGDDPMHDVWTYDGASYRHPTARTAFAWLFNTINGPGSWEKNPWVVGAEIEGIGG